MKTTALDKFNFCFAEKDDAYYINGTPCGKEVNAVHTWNVDQGTENKMGRAVYSTVITVDGTAKISVLHFEAVYHDCSVFLNGEFAGEHKGSGYTPFELNVSGIIHSGKNILTVFCDSSYSKDMLPNMKNFDWACDGGIIRNVSLFEYQGNCAKYCHIKSEIKDFLKDGCCNANIACDISLFKKSSKAFCVTVTDKDKTVFEKKACCADSPVRFSLENVSLWSPENPRLYTLTLTFENEIQAYTFGLRKIEAKGDKVYLNNKETKLLAVEWMPGSNPDYGMAEPESELERYLEMLKDMGCNFTRFHWQQSDFVFDWCDRNGIMVQEEIPYWGSPKKAGENELEIAKRQADDMLLFHYNHPSIVCWGVGNELNGHSKKTIRYVKDMYSYFKNRDNMRLVNYVSNTMAFKHMLFHGEIKTDAAACGDICMFNEYLGTWMKTTNYDKSIKRAINRSEGKPIVISEFGLCEPFFKGGDERRIEIYREKIAKYKELNFAGWIYFCLNDYRTHIGETGEGKFKQRIHGSTDLYGNKKPSYEFIKSNNLNMRRGK